MSTPKPRPGYTMIELAIVLVILGVLAGIAAPKLLGSSDDAAIEATILQLKTIAAAVEAHHNEYGDWPPDGLPGDPPPELDDYLRPNLLRQACPLGGDYDFDHRHEPSAPHCAISIAGADLTSSFAEIDARIDDGAPATGWVRYDLGDRRLMLVIEP